MRKSQLLQYTANQYHFSQEIQPHLIFKNGFSVQMCTREADKYIKDKDKYRM
jgi:hypothetical protein